MMFVVTGFAQTNSNNNKNVIKGSLVKKTASVESTVTRSFVGTWYCLRGRTASGSLVRQGIVAVDPRVITLGSTIFVEGMGIFTATDTGGLIKGARLDFWTPSCSNAIKQGRRTVKVRVIFYGNKRKS